MVLSPTKTYLVIEKKGWKHHIIRENKDCGNLTCCGMGLPIEGYGTVDMTVDELLKDDRACGLCLWNEGL